MPRTLLGQRIPEGMQDLLPEELALLEQLEGKILDLFRAWAYQKVVTPTLEYQACVGPETEGEDQLYKFFDRHGHVLTMRPELTTPIARLVSTRLRAAGFPLRLCYSADVFRNAPIRHREFRQAGAELIGSANEIADAEVIALAIESLRSLGLADFQINIGQMSIFEGLMEEAGVTAEFRAELETALARKDIVAIEIMVSRSGLPDSVRDFLVRIPHLHGGEEILYEVLRWSSRPAMQTAVASLRQIYRYLADYGIQQFVSLDLGILRGFSYYTGVVFEGYIPGIGFPVVEGGRYDSLYAEFGFPQPATGFALNLGSLLTKFDLPGQDQIEMLVYGSEWPRVVEQCRRFRQQGHRVEMLLETLTKPQAELIAREKRIDKIICADDEMRS